MVYNPRMICSLLLFIACLGNIASITRAQQPQPRIGRGFPGSAQLMQRDENSDINRQVRSNHFSAGILNQNYVADNRNNINYYRRSRVNAEFATASPAAVAAGSEAELVPISVATTATKTVQQETDGDDNHNHDEGAADGQAVDKRKLLLSNLHLFNGTDTKNLSDSQKMLLIQIADRVARYGENNLFRELANAQQTQKEGPVQEEGRANTKSDGHPTTVTKKAKPSKRPHAAVHHAPASAATLSSAAPSKASAPTTTTKRQPLPTVDSTVSAAPTKSSTKTKIRPNTSFTPAPSSAGSSPVTPAVASTQSLSTPSEMEKKSTTAATSRHTKKPPGSVEEIIYDYNVTASALIESLSKPSPTSNSLLYQQTLHPAAAGAANNKQAVNSDSNKTQPPTKPNSAAAVKPTKYHYYPHNQHIYLLPECATQQVCNAVYVRLNYTQPLCACPNRYRDPCSASLNEDDLHTTKLIGDKNRRAVTLAKTCESISEMKQCREPSEWSLLAVQNTRTGKSHYLVICRCPDKFKLEGPMSHDQPTYANLPGIRVFGMKCVAPSSSPAPHRKKPTVQQHRIPPKQGQSNYQYLHRPDTVVHASELPQHIQQHHTQGSLGALTNGYGRSADEAVEGEEQVSETTAETTTLVTEEEGEKEQSARQMRSMQLENSEDHNEQSRASTDNYPEPEFPWHKVMELQDALRWNADN